jgi:hypothetical protein
VSGTTVGIATFTFTDSNNGTFAYQVGTTIQIKTITREIYSDPVPDCMFGGDTPSIEATNYQGLWWAEPAGSEAGWGLSLSQQGGLIVAVWLTYDATGAPTWLSLVAEPVGQGVYTGDLRSTTGPGFNAATFDPNAVTQTTVGSGTLAFYNGNTGLFEYVCGNVSQIKRITRQVFRSSGTLCQ